MQHGIHFISGLPRAGSTLLAGILRSTIGAELAGEQPLGAESKLSPALRLGGLREYDDTGRPISAAVADATSVYLRYDGEAGSGADNHTLNLGLNATTSRQW